MVAAVTYDLGVEVCLMEAFIKPGKTVDGQNPFLPTTTKSGPMEASLIDETIRTANKKLKTELDAVRHGAQLAKKQTLKLALQEQALLAEVGTAIALEWECRDLAEKLAALEEDLSQRVGTNGALAVQLSKAIDKRRDDLVVNTSEVGSCQAEAASLRASCHELEAKRQSLSSELERCREATGKQVNSSKLALAEARSCRRAAEKAATAAEATLARQLKITVSSENLGQSRAAAAREAAEVELHDELEARRKVQGDMEQRVQDQGRRTKLWRHMAHLREDRAEDAVRCIAEVESSCLLARAEEARLQKAVEQASERHRRSQGLAEVAHSRWTRAKFFSKVSHFGPIAAALLGAWLRSVA